MKAPVGRPSKKPTSLIKKSNTPKKEKTEKESKEKKGKKEDKKQGDFERKTSEETFFDKQSKILTNFGENSAKAVLENNPFKRKSL